MNAIKDELKPPGPTGQVKAVLFDAVGTVIYADPPVALAYQRAAEGYGSRASLAEIERRFAIAFARQEAIDSPENAGRTGEARERHRWRSIVAEVFADIAQGNIDPLFETLWRHFAEPAHWTLFADVTPACRALAERGLTLGLASNFDARLQAICRGHAPLAACRHVFVSSQLGWRKPHAEFFAAIERALDLPPEQILLVGDSVEHDYWPALSAGWQAALLRRTDWQSLPHQVRRTGEQSTRLSSREGDSELLVIRQLTELIGLLGRDQAEAVTSPV